SGAMMRWIVGSSLKFRYLVVATGAALMVFGSGLLRDTPVDVFPEFAQPKVEIQTISTGLSAEEVESLITVPLEQSLQGIPGLETIRSKSVPQLSSIQLLFDRGTDLLHARQLVQERVATVTPTLPSWSSPPFMIQPLSSTSRVMKIGLTSDRLSLIDMSLVAYWKIRARLLRVPGVANVPIWGERLHQYHVQADPARLRAHDVSLTSLQEQTAKNLDVGSLVSWSDAGEVGTGGFIDGPNQRLNVRHVFPVITPTDFSNVTIENGNGETLLLSDVADLVIDHQPLMGDAVINDGPGLMLIVEKLPWANTLDVTRGVEDAMETLRPGLSGIEVDTTIFRPATFIETSIDNLTKALLI
ncbi:MAG: efflux RND transporter permease subunit, partial [Pseudonocardiaceae bacterium]